MRRKIVFEDQLEMLLDSLEEREHPPEFSNERFEQVRDFIDRKSPFEYPERYIARDIRGLVEFKRVLALSSISPFRPIHVVAIGDPATGKSQIAQAFQHITPQTRYCLGSKLTAAGLTLARLGNQVMCGVLPSCHVGAAYIDEFNLTKPEDAAAVLSTMQDGCFSVDKAFLKAPYVPAKASIVAMANPKGDYFTSASPHAVRRQMPFRSLALLTRFHLIYIVLRPSVREFEEISAHQLKYQAGSRQAIAFNERERELWRDAVIYLRHLRPSWTLARKFKRKLISTMTTEAYRQERKGKIAIPVSPRLNEGITHLAEAFARARVRESVWVRDVIKSIQLVANSLVPCGLDVSRIKERVAEVLKEYA